MAAPLRRVLPSFGRAFLSPTPARMLSAEASDALVEIKPGEIGMVSGIPEEHLRRRGWSGQAPCAGAGGGAGLEEALLGGIYRFSVSAGQRQLAAPSAQAQQQGAGEPRRREQAEALSSNGQREGEGKGTHEGIYRRGMVVIYSPARTASQQGSGKVGRWKINFVSTQKWENPLMGWTSTGDPYANVGEAGLTFDSADSAKAFAEKHGWDYVVRKRHTPLLKPKTYAENFKWKGPPKTEEAA